MFVGNLGMFVGNPPPKETNVYRDFMKIGSVSPQDWDFGTIFAMLEIPTPRFDVGNRPSLRHVSQFWRLLRVQGKHVKIVKVESLKMTWIVSIMFPKQSKYTSTSNDFMMIIVDTKLHQKARNLNQQLPFVNMFLSLHVWQNQSFRFAPKEIPKTNMSPPEKGTIPKRNQSSSHPFSGAMLVLGMVHAEILFGNLQSNPT